MLRNLFGVVGLVLIALAVASCMPTEKQTPVLNDPYNASHQKSDLSAYRLGPGDTVRVYVFDEPDLSSDYELDGRGIIDMPLISEVNLNGLTKDQATQEIRVRYKQGYLQDPKVSLSIEKYRPFFILGEVRSPGRYNFQENMNVLEAIALAEGFTYRANEKDIEILRKIGQRPQYFIANQTTSIMPGDVVTIKERFF